MQNIGERANLILNSHIHSVNQIGLELPEYKEACDRLVACLRLINDHRWVTKHLDTRRITTSFVSGGQSKTVDFQSLNAFPLFEKAKAGDVRLKNLPATLSQITMMDLREQFLIIGRSHLPGKKGTSENVERSVSHKPKPKQKSFLKRSTEVYWNDPTFRKAVQRAVELFHMGFTMTNCVTKSCENSGYPVKAHVDRGFRQQLSESDIELRRNAAHEIHGRSVSKINNSTIAIFREIRSTNNHFSQI
jgi:hypothetical protein